jgi:hypothetical protein
MRESDVFDELRSWPLVYLATPYSKYFLGHEAAFSAACGITARLMTYGIAVYSPIAHMHHVALAGDLDPTDHDFWTKVNRPMIDACHGLAVARIFGWDKSRGIEDEVAAFTAAGKPIVNLEVQDLY